MGNIFDYLRKAREERELQERIRAENEQALKVKKQAEEEEEKERARQVWREIIEKYRKTVIDVLEQLQQAVYPQGYVDGSDSEASWSIYYTVRKDSYDMDIPGGGGGSTIYQIPVVQITLELDSNRRPIRFKCWREGHKEIRVGLSQGELVRAINQLHPTNTV